jgi:predicted porin
MYVSKLNKTLIAFAVLALGGAASADSGVSITGNVDVGVKSTSNTDSTKNKTELTNNNVSTSLVYLKGFRDMGEGLKASFLLEADFNATQSSSQNASASGQGWTGTPFNGEQYLSLAGNFGDLKLGSPNSAGLTAGLMAQPFGTALGGGWSGAFGRLGTATFAGYLNFDGGTSARIVRHEKTMMYTTPDFGGFKATAEYAFGNDNSTTPTSNSNTNTTVSLQYGKNDLNAIYAYSNEKAPSNGAAGATAAIGTTPPVVLPAGTDVTWNILAASYKMNALTIMGGLTSTKHNASVALEDSSSWNIAAKYSVGAKVDLLGNYLVRTSNITGTPNATLVGLGVNYNLDTQTSLYARYEGLSFTAVGATASQNQNIWAGGIRYQF